MFLSFIGFSGLVLLVRKGAPSNIDTGIDHGGGNWRFGIFAAAVQFNNGQTGNFGGENGFFQSWIKLAALSKGFVWAL